eukprot:tig00001086_g6867.t1
MLKALKTATEQDASEAPGAMLRVATCLAKTGSLEASCGIYKKLLELRDLQETPKPFQLKCRALAARTLAASGGPACLAGSEGARRRAEALVEQGAELARGVLRECGVPCGRPEEALGYFAGDEGAFGWFTARSKAQLAFVGAAAAPGLLEKHTAFNEAMRAAPGWWSAAATALPRALEAVRRSMQDEVFGSSEDLPRDGEGLDERALYLLSLLSPAFVREIRGETLAEMARRQRAFLSSIRSAPPPGPDE